MGVKPAPISVYEHSRGDCRSLKRGSRPFKRAASPCLKLGRCDDVGVGADGRSSTLCVRHLWPRRARLTAADVACRVGWSSDHLTITLSIR